MPFYDMAESGVRQAATHLDPLAERYLSASQTMRSHTGQANRAINRGLQGSAAGQVIGNRYRSGRGFSGSASPRGRGTGTGTKGVSAPYSWLTGEGSQAFTGIRNPAAGAYAGIFGYNFKTIPRHRGGWTPGMPQAVEAPEPQPLPELGAGEQPRGELGTGDQRALGAGPRVWAHGETAPRTFRMEPTEGAEGTQGRPDEFWNQQRDRRARAGVGQGQLF